MKFFHYFLFGLVFFSSCDQYRPYQEPYQEFLQVGYLGHGDGLVGELRINIWGINRPCDSCHAVPSTIHADLGSCNSCHQPHLQGWKKSTVAIYHQESLPLAERSWHFDLKCQECHASLDSREAYKQVHCIQCHTHNPQDLQQAHEFFEEYDAKQDYQDRRCFSCHVKSGNDYTKYYDPVTSELL